MATVPPSVTLLLGELAHPVRLPVLLALEERPRSPSELAEDLGEPFHRVNHAVKSLARAGLVDMVRQERSVNAPNIYRRVYASRYSGWQQLADALQRIAATADAG
jgi:DNA-binding transcriptional ArsR family regulator